MSDPSDENLEAYGLSLSPQNPSKNDRLLNGQNYRRSVALFSRAVI